MIYFQSSFLSQFNLLVLQNCGHIVLYREPLFSDFSYYYIIHFFCVIHKQQFSKKSPCFTLDPQTLFILQLQVCTLLPAAFPSFIPQHIKNDSILFCLRPFPGSGGVWVIILNTSFLLQCLLVAERGLLTAVASLVMECGVSAHRLQQLQLVGLVACPTKAYGNLIP